MTQMEYIKSIAPDGYLEAFDEETLKDLFREQWEEYCSNNAVLEDAVNPINEKLDYMVLTLVREFGDKLAFKGGYMLTKLIPNVARQSTDIDFSIDYDTLYYEMLSTLKSIGDHFVAEGYIERYEVKESIEPHKSGGADFYASTGEKVLGIDVGWHPTNFGTMHTDIGIATVRHFTVERMVSDKFVAILTKKRFRRAKDLYDLYQIMQYYDLDLKLLRGCISARDHDAPIEWDHYPFNEVVLHEYGKAYEKLRVISIYEKKDIRKPDFRRAVELYGYLYEHVLDKRFNKWNHVSQAFE